MAPPLGEWFSEDQQALDSTFGSLWDACMLMCVRMCQYACLGVRQFGQPFNGGILSTSP